MGGVAEKKTQHLSCLLSYRLLSFPTLSQPRYFLMIFDAFPINLVNYHGGLLPIEGHRL